MNVLIIGNGSVHTSRFANKMIDEGNDVYLLSFSYFENDRFNESVKKISIYEAFCAFLINLFNSIYIDYSVTVFRILYIRLIINKIIKKYNIDSVLGIDLALTGPVLSNISKKIKKVVITIGNDYVLTKFPNPSFIIHNLKRIRKYCKKVDWIITGDKEFYKPIVDERGWNFGNWIYINHFGVETDRFIPETRYNDIKKSYNIPSDSIVASTFRPAREWFDFENILIAVKKTVKKHPNFYYIIGKGDKKTSEKLTILIKEMNLNINVILADLIKYEELHKHVAMSDILIDPINLNKSDAGYFGGISTSTLESMACGLIPVVSDRPGMRRYLPKVAHKFIFEDFEVDLVEKLELAIKERNNQTIKEASRKVVVEKSDFNKTIKWILSLMETNKI